MTEPTLVRAVYKFKGSNNDELKFKKGDVITITQQEDGGWWEGTLDGKTGWFPSNYVEEMVSGWPAVLERSLNGLLFLRNVFRDALCLLQHLIFIL